MTTNASCELSHQHDRGRLPKSLVEKLAKAQRIMEEQKLHISLNDKKTNIWIRNKTPVTHVIRRLATLNWKFVGHTARLAEGR